MLVPLPEPSGDSLPLEDIKKDPVQDVVAPTEQSSLRRLKALSTSTFESLAPVPSIFSRILEGKSPSSLVNASKPNLQPSGMSSKSREEEILNAAMNFAPAQVSQKQPCPKAKAGAKQKQPSKKKNITKGKSKCKSKKTPTKKAPVLKPKGIKAKGKAKGNVSGKGKGKGSGKGKPSLHEAAKQEIACPEYKVEDDPAPEDSYRNLYTSRRYNKAKSLALRFGLPREQANAKGREAAKVASAKWDAYRAEPQDVD